MKKLTNVIIIIIISILLFYISFLFMYINLFKPFDNKLLIVILIYVPRSFTFFLGSLIIYVVGLYRNLRVSLLIPLLSFIYEIIYSSIINVNYAEYNFKLTIAMINMILLSFIFSYIGAYIGNYFRIMYCKRLE